MESVVFLAVVGESGISAEQPDAMSADGDILQQGVLIGFEQFQTLFHAFGRHMVYVYRADSCPPADVYFLFSDFEPYADGKAGTR